MSTNVFKTEFYTFAVQQTRCTGIKTAQFSVQKKNAGCTLSSRQLFQQQFLNNSLFFRQTKRFSCKPFIRFIHATTQIVHFDCMDGCCHTKSQRRHTIDENRRREWFPYFNPVHLFGLISEYTLCLAYHYASDRVCPALSSFVSKAPREL